MGAATAALAPTIESFLSKMGFEVLEEELEPGPEVSKLLRSREGSRPLVFRVKGSRFPIASNLVDTREKAAAAAEGVGGEDLLYRALASLPPDPRDSFVSASFDELYDRVELSARELGAIKYYEGDAGLYITSAIIVARAGSSLNASVHRMLVVSDKRLVVRVSPRHLHRSIVEAREAGRELEVTILLGSHPALLLAASTSPPYGFYELTTASVLLGRKLPAAPSPIHGHLIPLGASIVAEARITLEEAPEGPFVDLLLTYDKQRLQPVVEIDGTWVIRGAKPCLHAILPGGSEHALLMGLPREAAIKEAVSRAVPHVVKVRLTRASGCWLHAVISIKKLSDGDPKNAILAAFAAHPSLKHVVVVDDDVDPDDPEEVEWAIATRFQADKGLVVISEAKGSTMDPSSRDGLTAKMGIDATKPVGAGREFERVRLR
ncbi:MAG: UbiD family decarboxylase [Fervidicoccaceae archaeon]